jgi:Leucine-rich repeat (LRR) protein
MKLPEQEAAAVCSTGLAHLTGLEKLDLQGSQLSSGSCAALAVAARDLPQLSSVHILDAEEQPREPAARAALMRELNETAGRAVFE